MTKNLDLYFDYAAATPMDPKVVKAMQPYFTEKFYNPSAIYRNAIDVKHDLDNARATVARELGCRPAELVFTAGGSEANNLCISGVMHKYPKAKLIISAIEHDSVLNTAKNYNHKVAEVNSLGIVNPTKIKQQIDANTVMVSIMLVNNEIGAIQPIAEIADVVQQERRNRLLDGNKRPIYLHTDAAQAVNYIDVSTKRLGVDFMSINGGKIYGPKQSGALFIRAGIELKPIIYGGGQEKGLRSGTENIASAVGFAKSLELTRSKSKAEAKRLTALRNQLSSSLKKEIPSIEINGPKGNKRIANNLHLTIPGIDNERLLIELDERDVMVATGSACSASSDEPSHVLKAMGKDANYIRSSIRITMGRYTNSQSVDTLVKYLSEILAK